MALVLSFFLSAEKPAFSQKIISESKKETEKKDSNVLDASSPSTKSVETTNKDSSNAEKKMRENLAEDLDLESAIPELLIFAKDAARIALSPIGDKNKARAIRIEKLITLALFDAGVEVITPATVQRSLGKISADSNEEISELFSNLSADHYITVDVTTLGKQVLLSLRLVKVETATVLKTLNATLDGGSNTIQKTFRHGMVQLADEVTFAMSKLPGEFRYQRLAIMPFVADGDLKGSKLALLLQVELADALQKRGFLLVERKRLTDAIEQVGFAESTGDEENGSLGRFLDAQGLVFGSVIEVGDELSVNIRVVSVDNSSILGTGKVLLQRENTVKLSSDSLELRTREEVVFRSIVAPGWGQMYNQKPIKGIVFSTLGYGGGLLTLGLGAAAGLSYLSYVNYVPDAAQKTSVSALREQTNVLLVFTAFSAVATGVVWGINVGDALLDGS